MIIYAHSSYKSPKGLKEVSSRRFREPLKISRVLMSRRSNPRASAMESPQAKASAGDPDDTHTAVSKRLVGPKTGQLGPTPSWRQRSARTKTPLTIVKHPQWGIFAEVQHELSTLLSVVTHAPSGIVALTFSASETHTNSSDTSPKSINLCIPVGSTHLSRKVEC